MSEQKMSFQAEVSRLLEIVAHSLYSETEVFLRELISNASDACDRLRYLAQTEPQLIQNDSEFKIRILADKDKKTLTISDNGIGMSEHELIENLGTIARSGTASFLNQLKEGQKSDHNLIGQFGVGFYSAFMVSEKVEVLTKKAGETSAKLWVSDGKGEFTIKDAEKADRGTQITMYLKEDALKYLEEYEIQNIVKKYSDHIAFPIVTTKEDKEVVLNQAQALWTKSKSDITPDQYKEFYHHAAHQFDEPWLTLHWNAEGIVNYTNLLFIPSQKPFDLFSPERKIALKLYVRRVFITDDVPQILPSYLRFVKGVVDCEDLPLNVSREMLQTSPVLSKIKAGITKRILSELGKKTDDQENYAQFWTQFGAVLKEGLYEDLTQKETLLELVRFKTTQNQDWQSLNDYVNRMKPDQEGIYYISGESVEALEKSPQLEGFKARGIEVLFLTDPIDEFWVPMVHEYKGKSFKSVTKGGADLDKIAPTDAPKETAPEGDMANLIAAFKLALGDEVKDIKTSNRLTDSAVCLVADETNMDIHLEKLLKQHNQLNISAKRILEINPSHPLIVKLSRKSKDHPLLSEIAGILLDQARIVQGEALSNPAQFSQRLLKVLDIAA